MLWQKPSWWTIQFPSAVSVFDVTNIPKAFKLCWCFTTHPQLYPWEVNGKDGNTTDVKWHTGEIKRKEQKEWKDKEGVSADNVLCLLPLCTTMVADTTRGGNAVLMLGLFWMGLGMFESCGSRPVAITTNYGQYILITDTHTLRMGEAGGLESGHVLHFWGHIAVTKYIDNEKIYLVNSRYVYIL